MKQTIKRSVMVSAMMGALVLVIPYLAPPKLVLRFLPEDIYEAAKDHPAPSKKKQLLGHLLTAAFCGYFAWTMKDNADRIKREHLGFTEAFKRLTVFMYMIKAFDIIALDQLLCMTSGYYKRFYPETKDCAGWHDRGWNNKKQGTRLLLYPVICAVQAYLLTKKGRGLS